MRKLILLFVILIAAMIFTSCNSSEDPITPASKGSIYLTSNPAGAQIWLDGVNTSQITPDTVTNVNEGVHNVTLKLQDYNDTTISLSVSGDQMSVLGPVALVTNIITTLFNPVRIYETTGTTANEPSGLDLSSGKAWGVTSDSSGLVDIYYSTSGTGGHGYLVQSADLFTGLIRETDFFVSSATNLFDAEDSPLSSAGTWTNNMGDHETNYVFLYDHDGHYSKLKVVDWGGGVPGEPAWVDVQWYYNNTTSDRRF
ncbi:MAG: PEGA domain-containing protein [Ignavibacteria bacterium]